MPWRIYTLLIVLDYNVRVFAGWWGLFFAIPTRFVSDRSIDLARNFDDQILQAYKFNHILLFA